MPKTYTVKLTFELVVQSERESEAIVDAAYALKAMPLGELVSVVVEQDVEERQAH